jgi:type II secretory pathway pseudopilin PulG
MNQLTSHNTVVAAAFAAKADSQSAIRNRKFREGGYTLVALLALMTVMALFAMAAAPSIVQQAQREKEQEAIFRGEEVADAIRVYYRTQVNGRTRNAGDNALPTSIDDLAAGVPVVNRVKKLQVLRPSAAHDPLSANGEWVLVHPRSPEIGDFVQKIMTYTQNTPPQTNDGLLAQQVNNWAPLAVAVTGLDAAPLTGNGLEGSNTGPFLGVSSRSKRNSVITYYGIEHHDQWVFTPLFR